MVGALDSASVQVRLETAGVPFAPLRRPDQLVNEPQLTESGQLLETPLVDDRTGWLPKLPLHSDAFPFSLRRLAPRLGEQTVEALQEAGYTEAEIRTLIDSGAALDGSATDKN
jgi:crotonobetainyl-CoA:carnitine CoA-transferase CaiB-like acyl-CoA transferase